MGLFKRRANKENASGTALADRPEGVADASSLSREELLTEIERLTQANRASRDRQTERRLLSLRHQAGLWLLDADGATPQHPSPDSARLPESERLPEIARDDVTPELLRAGILRDGCLLVRGLVDRDQALRFAAQIDRSFAERERQDTGGAAEAGYYEEFQPDARYGAVAVRPWVKEGGGVLAVDAPMLTFEMMEMFDAAALPRLVADYLGEPAMISVEKTTLRKAEPSIPGAWHQDGAFMGDVRALNLWLSLSHCGDEAPGLDIVPRRLDNLVRAQTEEAVLDYQVSQRNAEEAAAAGGKSIIRPIFEPGDALFFDELFLHQTGSDPSMPKPRFAIESWFFGGSAFPDDYVPVAV
jgi:Phytanoyl-CoA dioxygenase (PhyH)